MPSALEGKLALVTRACGGIGGAIALGLGHAGADVLLTYAGHRGDAETVAGRLRDLGRTATTVHCDLTVTGAAGDLVDQVTRTVRPLRRTAPQDAAT
jgi:3-oxoacyl-[acyl-carrier protein] reductase